MALSIQCSIRIISIAIYVLTIHTVATAKATKSVFYNVSHIISNLSYNEQSLILLLTILSIIDPYVLLLLLALLLLYSFAKFMIFNFVWFLQTPFCTSHRLKGNGVIRLCIM